MREKINEYLNIISSISNENLSCDSIYEKLISSVGMDLDKSSKNIFDIFDNISLDNKKFMKLENQEIIISNGLELDSNKKYIELGIFNKLDSLSDNVNKLTSCLNKKKISYCGKLRIYGNVGYLLLDVTDTDSALKVIDYINCKLNKNVYNVNPLFFCSGKVMVSFKEEYSYIEIISMYLYRYVIDMRKLERVINYDNFKGFIIDNYFKISNQIDMYRYLDFNLRDISLSMFFNNLEEITNIILYLFNGNDYEEFKSYFHSLNKRKKQDKYTLYDSFDDCKILLEELVNVMYLNYGEEYTKNNIRDYMNTGNGKYITRKNNLRKKIIESKTFMIFLHKISLDEEVDKIIDLHGFEEKKKILEDVCRETFLMYLDNDNKNFGKIQVARGLIRMEYGDYSAITRNNDARKMAIENIKPNDIVKLIKKTLGIEHVRKQEELYELYADYIENLCIG